MTVFTGQKPISKNFQWATKMEYFFYAFFRLITLCPINIIQNSNRLKIKFSNSSRLFALFGIFTIFLYVSGVVILRIFVLNSESELTIWNEATNICGIIFTCLVILIETQFTYKYFANFLHLKQKTENDLLTLCYRELFENEKYVYVKNYWRILIIFHLIAWTTEAISIINIQKDPLWRFYCCALLLPTLITRFRYFQHRLYTSTLHFYIKMIRLKIENSINDIDNNETLARQQHRQQFTMNSRKIFVDLKLSMDIFTSIFRMSYLVNKMFGLSMLMNIFENFIQLLSNLFWIYSKLYYEDSENVSGLLNR